MVGHVRSASGTALVLLVSLSAAYAQAPTGTITGIVNDSTRAVVADARVSIANPATAQTWTVNTSAEGIYTAAALLPGEYQVIAEVPGFKRTRVEARVEAGTTTSVDLVLELGAVTDSVTVTAAVPVVHYDHHQIGGVVGREQIASIPLNGRNFLELAKLEPGVTSPVRGVGNRTFVATLGSGLQTIPRVGFTRVTVDGASINAFGTIGTSLQISPEVVEEFQLTTANFDVATNLTTNGAVNIVTRSGGNVYHGTGFMFYRDHHLSAYPALRRDPRNPRPFFERRQFGTAVGGPLRKNRAFFIGSYERHTQQGVATIQPGASEFAPLGGIFETPANGDLVSVRIDGQLTSNHTLVARHTLDTSSVFGPVTAGVLPSGWLDQANHARQIAINGMSLARHRIVNEVRFSYFSLDSLAGTAGSSRCAGCFGVGVPRISVAGAGLTFGMANQLTTDGRRYQLSDTLTWQRGRHRLRFGVDWEHSTITSAAPDEDRVLITVWSPQRVRQMNQTAPPEARIALPASFATVDNVLELPLQSFEISIGPGAVLERDFRSHRILDLYRLYAADTWRIGPTLTLNAGLGWSYEPNALSHDLTKPPLLTPLLGERGLKPPVPRRTNFSPMLGFAWSAASDGTTIIRGGIGRFFDPASSANSTNLSQERWLLSPLGTGRLTVSGANIVRNGQPLNFRQQPTTFTATDLLTLLPGIRADLAQAVNPQNRDFALRNIDRTKQGTNLASPSFTVPSATHLAVGVQHQLGHAFVLSADIVWKRFDNTFINGIDYNRFNSAAGPVIRRCTDVERDDVYAQCSNGPIMFDTTIGRAQYAGLVVRAEKRLSNRSQFLAAYALGRYRGSNATGTGTTELSSGRATGFNNDDWDENYGPMPTDLRHILNFSGYLDLPWRFQLAVNVSATSRPPFTAWLEDVDINGDGTNDDLLPGSTVNEFGRGLDHEDLRRLVDAYNQQFAGKPLCCAQTAPRVTLPATYDFFDNFFTQDLRITHTLPLGTTGARLILFGEVFNLFNTANLLTYSGNLLEPSTFGQPAGRFSQVFGSGGPRAFQVGMRLSF